MAFRQGPDGVYSRAHTRAASSVGSGWSVLPPLTLKDTSLLHLRFIQQGLADASKLNAVIETLATNKVIQANTLKSSILQGVVLFSALVIQPLLGRIIPQDHSARQSTGGIVYVLFHLLWLYPLALASIVYSGLLKTPDLTDRRGGGGSRSEYRGITAFVVGESHKALVLTNYFLFAFLLRFIPFVGRPLSFLFSCIVNSYYCYEAQWLKLGWPFEERVKHLDSRWAYFIGFGFPITFLSWWSSDPVVNLALFSFFFPLFQIMSTSSIAQPMDPKLPTSSMSLSFLPQSQGSFSMAAAEGGEEARGRRGSPWIPVRIQVLVLADKVYGFLVASLATSVRKKDAGGPHYSHAPPPDTGGWRTDGYGMGPVPGAPRPSPPQNGGYAQDPYGGPSYGLPAMGAATGAAGSGFAPTPPRRGHVQTESSIGVGGEFVDRNLDSLINEAGRRKKGE